LKISWGCRWKHKYKCSRFQCLQTLRSQSMSQKWPLLEM